MWEQPRNRVTSKSVLLHIMNQDPSVVVEPERSLYPVQPVVARAANGFWDGPACDRIAIVDFSVDDGSLRRLAKLNPKGSQYRNVGVYDVPAPALAGPGAAWNRSAKISLAELRTRDGDSGFVKVSVFGTVIRAIGFVEDPVVLGRSVEWAFEGRQILVVPDAGTLDNAFYHRPSRSLQFFSYEPAGSQGLLRTGLSQDIVTHETAHALVDGIAPDLYDAVSPESLAIHESVADITAAMISLRSRDPATGRLTPAKALDAVLRSSRYSRIAEEFGRSRGSADALRDAINERTLNPRARKPTRVVDWNSPHSLSEVLTGAVFTVLVKVLTETMTQTDAGRAIPQIRVSPGGSDPFRRAAGYAINRLGSMLFKGLDWLPPGEAGFGDLARAMLAADQFHHPDLPAERAALIRECVKRHIATQAELETSLQHPQTDPFVVDLHELARRRDAARRFVQRHRGRLGIPTGPIDVEARISAHVDEPLLQQRHLAEIVDLDRSYAQSATNRVVLVKVAWWETQPVTLPGAGATSCDLKAGVTVAIDADGRVRALLRTTRHDRTMEARQMYLRRLADTAVLRFAGDELGPDGVPLRGRVPAKTSEGRLRVSGGFQALHIADDG
jgi:hypothetical protein